MSERKGASTSNAAVDGDILLRRTLACAPLHDACLTLPEAPACAGPVGGPKCSERPWRLEVYSPHATQQVATALKQLRYLPDPQWSNQQLRHLERDIFARSGERMPAHAPRRDAPHHMLWPRYEAGFAEPLMWTLLPLGHLLSRGVLPNTTWMISGALYTRSWAPLQRVSSGVCTFESSGVYSDTRAADPLPRCTSACFARLTLCEVAKRDHLAHAGSWCGQQAWDRVLGFAPLPAVPAKAADETTPLRVILPLRHSWHGRHLLNTHALVAACSSGLRVLGRAVSCQAVSLGDLPLVEVVRLLRQVGITEQQSRAQHSTAQHSMCDLHAAARALCDNRWTRSSRCTAATASMRCTCREAVSSSSS
jgi:hypothetical protein